MYNLVIFWIVTHRLKLFEHLIHRWDNVLGGLDGTFKRLTRINTNLWINIRIWRKEFWVWALDGVLSEICNPRRFRIDPLVPSFCPTIIMHFNLPLSELHDLCFKPLSYCIFDVDPFSHFMFPVFLKIKLGKILKLWCLIERRFLLEN